MKPTENLKYTIVSLVLLIVGGTARAEVVYDLDGFASDELTLTDSIELGGGLYTASLLNLEILDSFSELVFVLIDSNNEIALKLINPLADTTVSEDVLLGGGSYTVVLAGFTEGLSFARGQLATVVPIPAAIWMFITALGGFVVVGRRPLVRI